MPHIPTCQLEVGEILARLGHIRRIDPGIGLAQKTFQEHRTTLDVLQ